MPQLPQQECNPIAQESALPLSETLIAAEYTALRSEILQSSQIQFQLIIIAISVFGTILTVGLQLKSAPILLVYPILALLLSLMWTSHAYGIDMLGSYIQNVIERRVGTGNIGWENASRAKLPAHAAIAFRFSRWSMVSMQVIAVLAGIFITLSDITLLNIGLILLDVACTVYTIVLCEQTTRMHRKGKRLGEVHAEFIEKGAQATATKMAETIFEKTAEKSTEPATEKTSGQVIYEVSEQNA